MARRSLLAAAVIQLINGLVVSALALISVIQDPSSLILAWDDPREWLGLFALLVFLLSGPGMVVSSVFLIGSRRWAWRLSRGLNWLIVIGLGMVVANAIAHGAGWLPAVPWVAAVATIVLLQIGRGVVEQ